LLFLIVFASFSTVGARSSVAVGNRMRKIFSTPAMISAAANESPPREKKSSLTVIFPISNTSFQMERISSMIESKVCDRSSASCANESLAV
jgi:hypothetical protein